MFDIEKAFGNQLRESCGRSKDLAQDKLAAKADLNPSYVGFIERAERNPTLGTIYKLSTTLDVDIKVLFEF